MGGGFSHSRRTVVTEKPVINAVSDTAAEVVIVTQPLMLYIKRTSQTNGR
jgi:hypothetical protein